MAALQPKNKTIDSLRNVYVFNGGRELTPQEMKTYRVTTVLYTLLIQIVFGDDVNQVFKTHTDCVFGVLAPHKATVDAIMGRLLEKLRNGWCYYPDPAKTMFEVIKGILDVYFADNRECHVVWHTDGLFDHMAEDDAWQKALNDIKIKHMIAEADKKANFPFPKEEGEKSQAKIDK